MDPKSERIKTAFRMKYRYFKYIIILFRFTYVLGNFINMIDIVLREYFNLFVTSYLDDILLLIYKHLIKCNEYVIKIFSKL
jgi:hypothetical protein